LNHLVLDASVAVKWFLLSEEPWKIQAMGLLARYKANEFELVVPDLFWAECGNVLWKATRQGRSTLTEAEESLRRIKALGIPTVPSAALLERAFAIARQYGRSFYDSLYVALAASLETTLITADQRLANAVVGHLPVKWLGEI
jgi:predicted nucleic acid-binding protein